MKKFLALCLTLLMVMGVSLTSLAASNGFVSSPSRNNAPELIGFKAGSDDCKSNLEIVSYGDRDKLSDEDRKALEKAYADITNSKDLTDLTSALKNITSNNNIDPSNLAVSDLFSIISMDCLDHDGHSGFDITLKPESIKDFVALLRLNGDTWEVVDGVKVSGDNLIFNSNAPYPFAIVVNTASVKTSPDTGDNANVFYLIVMLASVSVLAFVWKKAIKTN